MFEGNFNRDQLVTVVESMFTAALDRIECRLPSGSTMNANELERGHNEQLSGANNDYHAGILETLGMSLGVFYATLTDDGLGVGDALEITQFNQAIDNLIEYAWHDGGKNIKAAHNLCQGNYTIPQLYGPVYPDARKHAEKFVDTLFKDYLEDDTVVFTKVNP